MNFATNARAQIRASDGRPDRLGDGLQRYVTQCMTAAIIDRLKAADIKIKHRRGEAGTSRDEAFHSPAIE
jgi:hypothetical protein